jgi:hypothetical protein
LDRRIDRLPGLPGLSLVDGAVVAAGENAPDTIRPCHQGRNRRSDDAHRRFAGDAGRYAA